MDSQDHNQSSCSTFDKLMEQESNHGNAVKSQISVSPKNKNENIGKVIYIGMCFCVLYTGLSASNLVASIYDTLGYKSLGQVSSTFFYAVFSLSAIFAPKIMEGWPYKKAVFIGALGYIFPLISGMMTSMCSHKEDEPVPSYIWCTDAVYIYSTNILTNAINGVTAVILWIGVNQYITSCADESNQGKYLGLFYAINNVSSITGGIMSTFVLAQFGFAVYFTICSLLVVLAIMLISVAPEAPKRQAEESETIKETCNKILRLTTSPRMSKFVPYMMFAGLVTATFGGFQYKIVERTVPDDTDEEKASVVASVLMLQGVITIFLSYTSGKLADIFKLKSVLLFFLSCFFLAIASSFWTYEMNSLFLSYIMAVIWGLSFSGANTLTGVAMMKDFDGRVEAYAVQQLISNLGTIVGNILIIFISDIPTFLFALLGFLVCSEIVTCFYRSKDMKEEGEEQFFRVEA